MIGSTWSWISGALVAIVTIYQTAAFVVDLPFSVRRGWRRSGPWREAIRTLPGLVAQYRAVVAERDVLAQTRQDLVRMVANLEKQHQELRAQMAALQGELSTIPNRMNDLEEGLRSFVERQTDALRDTQIGIGNQVTELGIQVSDRRRETADLAGRVAEIEHRVGIRRKQPPS
jgi:chromosome segregation ATPase